MVAKVCSWCGSRLGASAAIAASSTPPRRGVSAAGATPGAVATRTAIESASVRILISVLGEPDVLQLLVREVARLGHVILDLAPVHDVARHPKSRHVVRVLEHDLLELDHELLALGWVERSRLPVE